MPTRRPVGLAFACVLAALAGMPAAARQEQPASGVAPTAAEPPSVDPLGLVAPWPAVTVEEALAQPVTCPASEASRLLERAVLLDLRLQSSPTIDDFELASLGFAAAAGIRPDDANLWRRVAEAAFNAGDRATLERATREIVRLDPSDTVAQLRLITMRIGRLQTGGERLTAYERLLGPGGGSLDASVRSRLALDAAMLAREMGDQDGFVRLLTMSTQLDSTHKEAAYLALAYYQSAFPDDPVGRLRLMCNLLLADPLDPHVHLAIGAEMSSHAAFAEAARFHNNARAIIGASDPEMARLLDVRGLILNWQLSGPEAVVEALNGNLSTLKHDAAYDVAMKEQRGMAVRDEERPENIRLPRELEVVRLMAADAAGYREIAAESARDLTAQAIQTVQFYQRPENQPVGEEGRELAQRILEMWIETLVVRAWSSGDMESLAVDLQRTIDEMGATVDLSEARAWFGLRTGQQDAVVEFFRLTQDDLYRSRLGYAMALEAQGRQEEAVQVYAIVAREDPSAVQSAWARSRLLFMTGQDLARTEWYDQVVAIAAEVPRSIDAMLYDPSEYMRLQASAPRIRLGPLDETRVEIALTNRGTMPLSLGSDRAIDARLLLSPQARVGSISVTGAVQPEVVDMDRRLRLMPGETVRATVPLGVGFTEAFMETQCASRTGMSWRAIQGFRIVESAFVTGPLCLSTSTPEIYREPLLLARLTPEDLAIAARRASPEQIPAVARAVWGACLSDSYSRTCTPEQVAALAAAMRERYDAADTPTRTLLLGALPTAALAPGFEAFDDGVRASIATQTDSALLMAALLTRARSADDPIIAACLASADPGVARAAELQAVRFGTTGTAPLSTVGPGLATLMGPALPSLRGVIE